MEYARIEEIAKNILNIEILKRRGSDALDFHDLHVSVLERALKTAYRLGLADRIENGKAESAEIYGNVLKEELDRKFCN